MTDASWELNQLMTLRRIKAVKLVVIGLLSSGIWQMPRDKEGGAQHYSTGKTKTVSDYDDF